MFAESIKHIDYQQRVAVNQQEIEDLNNVSKELQSKLISMRSELQQLKAENCETDMKFQKLLVFERQNVARLREAENRYSGLEQSLSSILAVTRTATPWERLAALGTRSDCDFPCLCIEDY